MSKVGYGVGDAVPGIDFVTDERERFAAQREEWRAMSIAHEARAESAEAKLAEVERSRDEWMRFCGKAEAERDAAIAERDARPAITREDARIYRHATGEGASALWRVERALEAHAKGGER